jgi:hypothetical protein
MAEKTADRTYDTQAKPTQAVVLKEEELDAPVATGAGKAVAITSLKLEHEGFERDLY